ncbi:M48 family metallopeptidase [Rhabdaerophilum sp.]|uniref:M48 family metallopeptidase n=1 Tax=Rhabdaerophilum sp. TaxID=2717341 RepID=UPI0038D392D3
MAPSRLIDLPIPPRLRKPAAPPRPIRIEMRDGPQEIAVVVRPAARRMILRIDRRTGGATLTLPRGVARHRAEQFVLSQAGWLEARLKALPPRVAFADGATLPIRGVEHRIRHAGANRGATRIEHTTEGLVLLVHGASDALPGRVLRFLKAEALADLTVASRRHAATLGVAIGRISIKDTVSRWGSCSSRGNLAYSWRLILAPGFVLDYLAAHEVAHRLEMNHSARYWRNVRTLVPDFRVAEDWLNRHGPALHHYGP